MKKIILLFLLSLNPNTSFISNGLDYDDPERKLRSKIATLLEDPDIILKENIRTKIVFEINDDKKINVLDVKPQDAKIINYVKSRLNDKKIKFSIEKKLFSVAIVLEKNR
ncbi:hypothetical protein Q4Q34_05245 [Flavivirga abyssicola]|uniref:hypothetical protein n=1 Tax=Flavivirga abyssicola TaxID=3063533 RepID=UPI0026DF9AB3|nr:hypothetical protein [Flavivirga sp. MEBiC07777]WVK14431.1 hypothetical protein Q4Q34_05245 [Flavivirga sp. MEBiC07777]